MIDTVYRRAARYYSTGEDRFVKRLKILCVHLLVQFQRNASNIDHSTVVAQRFIKLLFTRDLHGDSKLTANFTLSVKQRDMMAARRGVNRESQPCRACADNGQFFCVWPALSACGFRDRRAGSPDRRSLCR